MAYTLEPSIISHITKELPSCVTVAVDEMASS